MNILKFDPMSYSSMDPLTTFIMLIVLGFFFAILSSMIGIGGGLLNVPTLDFGFGLETADATFVSSFVIVFQTHSLILCIKLF